MPYDCPRASKVTLKNKGKQTTRIHDDFKIWPQRKEQQYYVDRCYTGWTVTFVTSSPHDLFIVSRCDLRDCWFGKWLVVFFFGAKPLHQPTMTHSQSPKENKYQGNFNQTTNNFLEENTVCHVRPWQFMQSWMCFAHAHIDSHIITSALLMMWPYEDTPWSY